jgi:hypothetical protein
VLRRLIFVAYFLEVGLLLILVPWSAFWERNYFAQSFPALLPVLRNNFLRGAVSGLGIVNLLTGFRDLADLLMARRMNEPVAPSQDRPSIPAS